MDEFVFDVTQEADGGYVAECLSEPIFAQADTWDELRDQVLDSVRAYCFDRPVPRRVRLHFVRDDLVVREAPHGAASPGAASAEPVSIADPASQLVARQWNERA